MNIVILKGNLTRDPELKYVSNGTAVTNFTIAVNRHFKRQDGSKDKETTFVDCEVWDTAAEHLNEYCSKGDPILVNGTLKLDSWETSEGQKRSRLRVRVTNFELLPRGAGGFSNNSDESSESNESETEVEAQAHPAGADIPF